MCPHKHAPAWRIRLLEENETSLPGTWDCTRLRICGDTLEEHSQALAFRSVLSKDKRRHNPPPTSISMALNKNHPISHLPSMNSNYGGTGYEDKEQPSPWTQIHSKYRSGHHSTSQSNKNTRFVEQKDIRQPPSTHEHHNSVSWMDNDRAASARRFLSGGPPDDSPPDGDGPPGGGYGSRPIPNNGLRQAGENPFSYRQQGVQGQGSPGGGSPGGGPDYGIEPEEGDQNKGEWQINNKISMGTVPQWNGDPTTLIDYIMEIALLA